MKATCCILAVSTAAKLQPTSNTMRNNLFDPEVPQALLVATVMFVATAEQLKLSTFFKAANDQGSLDYVKRPTLHNHLVSLAD